MNRKLYQELATLVDARINCSKPNVAGVINTEWFNNHTDKIENYLKSEMPHGSGLDYTWKIDYKKSTGNKLVFHMSFHSMDENGYYDGIIDFTVTVTPSLTRDINLSITGNFGKHQDLRDYLYETIDYALCQDVLV